ncbi:MAG: hypothetical protein HOE90_24280 [Bacteriovoracaceae bacterium]|nr:hypothetical protein [Bacteriovoracaceae bacterium]
MGLRLLPLVLMAIFFHHECLGADNVDLDQVISGAKQSLDELNSLSLAQIEKQVDEVWDNTLSLTSLGFDEVKKASVENYIYIKENLPKYIPKPVKVRKTKSMYLYFIPDSIKLKFAQFDTFDIDGGRAKSEFKWSMKKGGTFSPFKSVSFTHLSYPYESNSYKFSVGPALTIYNWNGVVNVFAANPQLATQVTFHTMPEIGSLKARLGIGPMYLNGKLNEVVEEKNWHVAATWQVSFYRFFGKKIFSELKFSETYLGTRAFEKKDRSSKLSKFNSLGFYMGYRFDWYLF